MCFRLTCGLPQGAAISPKADLLLSPINLHRFSSRCCFDFPPQCFLFAVNLHYVYNSKFKISPDISVPVQSGPVEPWQLADPNVPIYIRAGPGRGSKSCCRKGAHVYMKAVYVGQWVSVCVCVCALSQGLRDYVDKRCTWCFRLSFSPPLPPFILPPSPSPPAISNISLRLLKD